MLSLKVRFATSTTTDIITTRRKTFNVPMRTSVTVSQIRNLHLPEK